jgi:hypothetical protein
VAGVFGVVQDPATGALSPEFGWAVVDDPHGERKWAREAPAVRQAVFPLLRYPVPVHPAARDIDLLAVTGTSSSTRADPVAVEEPLEIRAEGPDQQERSADEAGEPQRQERGGCKGVPAAKYHPAPRAR